jgi:hypothetical protein
MKNYKLQLAIFNEDGFKVLSSIITLESLKDINEHHNNNALNEIVTAMINEIKDYKYKRK